MKVGKEVENFRLKDQNGNLFDLYENLDKHILLVFYPKDNSKVCSKQLNNYHLKEDLFLKKGIRVIGINIESINSHKKFCEDKNIGIPLLFDENGIVSRKFKALNFIGMNKRKIVLIDKKGEVALDEDITYFNFPTAEDLVQKIEKSNILQKT
jgi:thioredoxin-dependent peroxiredoxin